MARSVFGCLIVLKKMRKSVRDSHRNSEIFLNDGMIFTHRVFPYTHGTKVIILEDTTVWEQEFGLRTSSKIQVVSVTELNTRQES